MPNRGSIVSDPSGDGKIVAEAASRIPIFWLSLVSLSDLANAECAGQYEISKTDAVERARKRLPVFAHAFHKSDAIQTQCDLLIQQLEAVNSDTIGIDITELLPMEDDSGIPDISFAVAAIETGEVESPVVVPAITMDNPFTR